jgi:hypothetical protein
VYTELPGPAAVCLPKHALCELGDRVLGGDRIVEHRRVQRAPPPPPLRPHRATPATVYQARPKANPGTRSDTHDRVRTDRVDEAGSVTLRVAGRLHHIGVGRTHARTRVLILVHDLNIRIIKATTGELLRDLNLDPTRDYQPTGAPKGPKGPNRKTPNPMRVVPSCTPCGWQRTDYCRSAGIFSCRADRI